jgi:copper chaperone CopZ
MRDPIVRKRKVVVEGLAQVSEINRIEEGLMKITGMISVDVNVQKKALRLNYDLRKTKFEVIEKSIKELGLNLSQKFFQRLKRGMAKFTEQNELDNLNAPLSSCCDDPKGNVRDCNSCLRQ